MYIVYYSIGFKIQKHILLNKQPTLKSHHETNQTLNGYFSIRIKKNENPPVSKQKLAELKHSKQAGFEIYIGGSKTKINWLPLQ